MNEGKPVIFSPTGAIVSGGATQLERVVLKPGVGEWFVQYATICDQLQVGNHCRKCNATFTGRNSERDRMYVIACSCREIIWPNRDFLDGTVN